MLRRFLRPTRSRSLERTPGQAQLLRAVRIQDNKDIGAIIEAASIDDLEWFKQMLALQLEETPHWIKDEKALHDTQAWTRHVRTLVIEALHNKHVKARPNLQLLRLFKDMFLVVFGVVLGLVMARYFG